MKGMDPRPQVKQYVGLVTGGRGTPWTVFETGDARYYLLCRCYPGTLIWAGPSRPVRKADLRDDVRKALRKGRSFDARQGGVGITPGPASTARKKTRRPR